MQAIGYKKGAAPFDGTKSVRIYMTFVIFLTKMFAFFFYRVYCFQVPVVVGKDARVCGQHTRKIEASYG
jgi:hypothetical protein